MKRIFFSLKIPIMKSLYKLLILTIAFTSITLCHANLLKSRILKGKKGEYVVMQQGKMTSILSIHSHINNRLILEEIAIPSARATNINDWKNWVKNEAPGHSSWVMYEVDLKKNTVIECYSFSKSAWLDLSQQSYWLASLFKIPLKKVPESHRKKIGPEPHFGEKDYRKVWNPTVHFESQEYKVESTAYKGVWPDDGSELAKKRFEIYFDSKNISSFPTWVQVSNPHITFNVQIIDSGHSLKSIYKSIPRRAPEFTKKMIRTAKEYQLFITSPEYYEELILYARDLSSPQKTLIPIHTEQVIKNHNTKQLTVPNSSLCGVLKNGHRYSWVISPKNTPSIHTESSDTFKWHSDSN